MAWFNDLTEGVEGIWVIWLACLLVLGGSLLRLKRAWQTPKLETLVHGEDGLSYTISYTMAIPVYLFLLCIAYEASWLLIAKIGTMYAAHAGARSAVVWESMEPASLADERINQSVWTAMAPFATTSPEHAFQKGGPPTKAYTQALEFVAAYEAYSSKSENQPVRWRPYAQTNAPTDSLYWRYLVAAARTRVNYEVDPSRADGLLTMTVTYAAPLRIPGPARWLDPNGRAPYEYPVRSKAVLPNEAPDNRDRTLGIEYRSARRLSP